MSDFIWLVERRKKFTITDKLEGEYIFMLESVSLIPKSEFEPGSHSYVVHPKKEFVPSFDSKVSDTVSIISWGSRTPIDDSAIKIHGNIDMKNKTIDIQGKGFEFVNIIAIKIESNKG
jgi:hypothetical protein